MGSQTYPEGQARLSTPQHVSLTPLKHAGLPESSKQHVLFLPHCAFEQYGGGGPDLNGVDNDDDESAVDCDDDEGEESKNKSLSTNDTAFKYGT